MPQPVITVKDPSNVIVDGQNVGQAVDAMRNNPALASGIQIALKNYVDGLLSDHAQQLADAVSVAAEEKAVALANLEAQKNEELAAANARIAELAAQVPVEGGA